MRTDYSGAQKKLVDAEAFTIKAKVRPRSRWPDELEENMKKLNMNNCREFAKSPRLTKSCST